MIAVGQSLNVVTIAAHLAYDAHITRAEFWAENDGHEITLAEWLVVAEADAELERPDTSNVPVGEGHFVARGLCENGQEAWFDWSDGDVFTKNSDAAVLRKMYGLAQLRGATVQGEDGEEYDAHGEQLHEEETPVDAADLVAMPATCARCGRSLAALSFFEFVPRLDGGVDMFCPACESRKDEPLSARERLARRLRPSQ